MAETNEWVYQKEVSGYRVRSASLAGDLFAIRQFRDRIFQLTNPEAIQRMNRRDLVSQHLLVELQATGEIVGYYRLTRSENPADFDASDCFDLSEILSKPGLKMELSYACVHPEHRNGPVIRMLLSAIRDCCRHAQITTVFGCASLATNDSERALKAYDILTRQKPIRQSTKTLAPLLRFYFQLGAIVLAPPLFDSDLSCFDFFMMLDLSSISDSTWLRMLGL